MGAGIPEDVNEVIPMALLADIAHSRRNPPRIEAKLAGTRRAEGVEEFIDFQSGHRSILSFRYYHYDCNDGQLVIKSIHHSPTGRSWHTSSHSTASKFKLTGILADI